LSPPPSPLRTCYCRFGCRIMLLWLKQNKFNRLMVNRLTHRIPVIRLPHFIILLPMVNRTTYANTG
jgi:hypothetical protein